jgi:hypothetical protein
MGPGSAEEDAFNGTIPLDIALEDYPSTEDLLIPTQELFDRRVIISGDPGIVNDLGLVAMLGTVTADGYDAIFTKRLLSSRAVYSLTGTNSAALDREEQLPENVQNFQAQLSDNHPRSMDAAMYTEYTNTFNEVFNALHQYSESTLPQKATLDSKEQRFYSNFVNDLYAQAEALHRFEGTLMSKKPVLVLGAGSMKPMKKKRPSHAGTLLKYLKRFFLVITLDEYNTSKRCPKCLGILSNVPNTHRIKRCDNPECQSTAQETDDRFSFLVNRDIAAPVNNVRILLNMMRHGRRPLTFTRPQRNPD